jgi:hypothetical protein
MSRKTKGTKKKANKARKAHNIKKKAAAKKKALQKQADQDQMAKRAVVADLKRHFASMETVSVDHAREKMVIGVAKMFAGNTLLNEHWIDCCAKWRATQIAI